MKISNLKTTECSMYELQTFYNLMEEYDTFNYW
jgi:hypothetical protein